MFLHLWVKKSAEPARQRVHEYDARQSLSHHPLQILTKLRIMRKKKRLARWNGDSTLDVGVVDVGEEVAEGEEVGEGEGEDEGIIISRMVSFCTGLDLF